MNDTTVIILLFALTGFMTCGLILFAGQRSRTAARIAEAVARIGGTSRVATDTALATVRAEVVDLLDVHEHDVTARCERSLLPGRVQNAYAVIVRVRVEPTEALLDTLVDLEQRVRAKLPTGAKFTIDACRPGQGSMRPAAVPA